MWKAKKDSVQREKLAVFDTMTVSTKKKTQSSSHAPKSQAQTAKEDFQKEVLLEAAVHQEGNVKNHARIMSKESAQIRRVIIGIFPYVKITKLNRDADSAISACSSTLRLTVSPEKIEEKWRKGSVALLKKAKHLGCVFQDAAPPKCKSTLRKSKKTWDQSAPCTSQKVKTEHLVARTFFSVLSLSRC